jgi:UDP-hydrolysing UDP-N-acetyl-D-glucosamine 2-epimerase
MGIKIGFITGARSEFGVMKNLIQSLNTDKRFDVKVYATGMHLLEKYGSTYKEIIASGIEITKFIPTYSEDPQEKVYDFMNVINNIYKSLVDESLDIIYIIGDRIEAYGSALASHFLKIPIVHFAGGQITEGAVDNIYRYNISNLADLHFVTNKNSEHRLKKLPVIDSKKVFLVGSSAIDSIKAFLNQPHSLDLINPELKSGEFILVTYHSITLSDDSIYHAIRVTIETILAKHKQVLITYPNNDDGSEELINELRLWENTSGVFVVKNLGVEKYYTAINHCMFVVGNSSSGIIEVPYFSKLTLNVGERQKGRLKPHSVVDVPCDEKQLSEMLKDMLDGSIPLPAQEYLYGNGGSVDKIKNVLLDFFYT